MALTDSHAIEVRGLGRRFGMRWVLRGVTFDVGHGEIVGLLGANGSGKSTVLRVLATLLRPNAGAASVNGHDVVLDADAVRSQVGYLAHVAGLYEDLTAAENLHFAADMLGLSRERIPGVLATVGLEYAAQERVRGFSAGMQRRLALARLLLIQPRVLLLDEPYSNLDTQGIGLVNDVIGGVVSRGGAALLVLHELAPASGILSRTITIENGRIAAPVQEPLDAGRSAAPVATR